MAKILLVEDELIIAAAMKLQLQTAGYQVIGPVISAQQILAAMEQNQPDLVLMDIRIRGPIDGIQVAQQISESLRVPIIFLSAHGDKSSRERAIAAGAVDYLIKPVAHTALLSAIASALEKRRSES